MYRLTIYALLLQTVAMAQQMAGTVSGTVADTSGKALSGVSMQLRERETNRLRTGASSASGDFLFSETRPGEYTLEVQREGSRKYLRSFTVGVNQELWLEVVLPDGPLTETVQVTAAPSVLRTESAAMGGLIANRQITGLPLDGRNFFELGLLLSGVAPAAQGSAGSVRGDFAVNINGGREDANQFLLDGVFNGDPKLNGVSVTPPVDAVREFEVSAGAFDATFGRNSGGQFNVVLKSGGNDLHGTAYEFFRNRVLDARNFFAPGGEASPQYSRNQFGASAGGPVRRDRTFFFVDFEGRRVREGLTRVTNVPTALERRGDFSRSGVYAVDPMTQRPFPGNAIPQPYLNPVGLAIAALYPQPNRAAAGQNYVSSPAAKDREDHFDLRLDHELNRAGALSVRYSFADRSLYEPFSGPDFAAIPGFGTDVPRRAQNAAVSHTYGFDAGLLNEVRLGFNRVSAGSYQENMGRRWNQEVGLPEISSNPRDTGLSLVKLTGYSPVGDEYHNPQHGASTVYQVVDTVTAVRGRHLLKAGLDFRRLQQNAFRDEMSLGYLSFLGMTGSSLAELLMGMPSVTAVARADNHQHLRTGSASFFAQDTWRAAPSLTLSAGVRYEYHAPPVDAQDRANLYDAATQSLVPAGTAGLPRGGYAPDRNNFGPRVGIAWRPGGGGSTVVRAGYGVYYDVSALATGEGLYFNAPYYDLKLYYSFQQFPLSLSDPFPKNYPLQLPGSALAFQRDLRTAYTQHWDFTLQREIGKERVLELAYAGSKGSKLVAARDMNQPAPSANAVNYRPAPQFDDINVVESRGNSNYHSLQARFQQNVRRGLAALGSYTWSKSIDDGSNFFTSAGDPNFPQDSRNAALERALSNFDVRHRLAVSYLWDVPGRGKVLGGWQTSGVWSFQTGRPFTVALIPDLDNSNTGRSTLGFGANDRPNVLRNPALAAPGADRWFDTGAFAMPDYGSFGNAGRNIVTGPGRMDVNASLAKNVRLAEGVQLAMRGEAFNLFNHTNLDLPDIFFGSPTFGRIQSAGSPRRIQFGLKLIY